MAYISKEQVKEIREKIKKAGFTSKNGWKITIKRDTSTYGKVIVTIRKSPIDFFLHLKEDVRFNGKGYKQFCYPDDFKNGSEAQMVIRKLEEIIRSVGYYDNSQPEVDYFDVAFYYQIQIGEFDKPVEIVRK